MDYKIATQPVDAEEFCSLATSRQILLRADDETQEIRGLLDPVRRVRYVISERQLFAGPDSFHHEPVRPL